MFGTQGMLSAIDTMGQDAGGRLTGIDAATGGSENLAFDTQASPFLEQGRAFGSVLPRVLHVEPFVPAA